MDEDKYLPVFRVYLFLSELVGVATAVTVGVQHGIVHFHNGGWLYSFVGGGTLDVALTQKQPDD